MTNTKKVFLILGGVVAVTGIVFFLIPPKAKVTLRKDGTGTASLGGATKEFSMDKGVDILTFNGYELHVFGEDIWLRKWGRDVVNKDGTPKIEIIAV
jgi:hypothetical protein